MCSDAGLAENRRVPMLVWRRWIGRGVFFLTALMCLYLGVTIWAARGNLLRRWSNYRWKRCR